MNIINWTKHNINIFNELHREVMVIPPSGLEARVRVTPTKVSSVHNIPLFHTKVNGGPYLIDDHGNKSELPPLSGDTIYVVSAVFRSNYDRADFYQPGQLIRGPDGNPIGCIGLSR